MGRKRGKYIKRSEWPTGCPRHPSAGRNSEFKCVGCLREAQVRFYDRHRTRLLAAARARAAAARCAIEGGGDAG
jgi:hypothetical protein